MRREKAGKTYKDRLFRMIFREKKDLLDLYNAVNESHYTDPEQKDLKSCSDG